MAFIGANLDFAATNLACVTGARKGRGNRAHAMQGGGGGGTEAPTTKPLFISSFSFVGERKIAIGSFFGSFFCQSLLGMTF